MQLIFHRTRLFISRKPLIVYQKNMFPSFFSFRLPSFGGAGRRRINIEPVKVHEVETASKREARTLKHLLKANHANFSIIYNNLMFHNHMPHILGSAYILGADSDQLQKIYDTEAAHLEPWKDSPGEISINDWRDYLGKKEYQRAYIDFFEDQLVAFGYDWKQLLDKFLYEGDKPLIHSMASGLGHCVIHLGYAYELNSVNVAIESLGLTTCFYDPELAKFANESKYTRPAPYKTKSVLEILQKIHDDKRFDELEFPGTGPGNIGLILEKAEEALLDHWNAWDLSEPTKQLQQSQEAVTGLLVAGQEYRKGSHYDFFLCHCLTTSHALRVLLPVIRPDYQISLTRQWLLFTVLVYISQLRPDIKLDRINEYPIGDKNWDFVVDYALKGKFAQDAHYVKANRAMKVMSETWGDKEKYYLKAAAQFADQFGGWGGGGDEHN